MELSQAGSTTVAVSSTDRAAEPPAGAPPYRAILDSLPDQIAVIDHTGVITYVNAAWQKFARENGDPNLEHSDVGVNYLIVSRSAQGEATEGSLEAATGLVSILQGKLDYFEEEYPCATADEELWFVLRATPLQGSQPRSVVTAHNNITRHKRAAQEQLEAELRDGDDRERASLAKLSQPRSAEITARSFGLHPLRETAGTLFAEWVERYTALIALAVDQRTYKIDHDLSAELRALAERLCFMKAGPRDVIDVHVAALNHGAAQVARPHVYVEEARVLLLELMGYLVAIYRDASLSPNVMRRASGG
jgi:hypothetical protein